MVHDFCESRAGANVKANQIRPIAIGRNWLFADSLRAGQRAAAVMSLIQSAKLNGHDPHAYLKDVLTRLPTHMKAGSTSCCRTAGHRLGAHMSTIRPWTRIC